MFTKWEDRFAREKFLSQNGPSNSLTKRSVPFSLTKRAHKTVPFSHKAAPHPISNSQDLHQNTLQLDTFLHADHGGDPSTRRSTSGLFSILTGKHGTRIPIAAHSKRQGQTGLSTPEAETLATVVGAKRVIRLHMLWQRLLKYQIPHFYYGDNNSSSNIIAARLSAQLAYMKRTQGISLSWANEYCAHFFQKVSSARNTSDIATKCLDPETFHRHVRSMNIAERPEAGSEELRKIVQLRKNGLSIRILFL